MQCVQSIEEVFDQVGQLVRAPVCQGVLEMIPHALIRIEFRRIGGKAFEVQARETATQISDWLSPVCVEVVPDHDDVAPKVTQQVTQELTDLALLDVLDVQAPVEANAPSLRAHRQPGDGRDLVPALPVSHHGRFAAGRPGLAHTGSKLKARFVYEDNVGAQPRLPFLGAPPTRRDGD